MQLYSLLVLFQSVSECLRRRRSLYPLFSKCNLANLSIWTPDSQKKKKKMQPVSVHSLDWCFPFLFAKLLQCATLLMFRTIQYVRNCIHNVSYKYLFKEIYHHVTGRRKNNQRLSAYCSSQDIIICKRKECIICIQVTIHDACSKPSWTLRNVTGTHFTTTCLSQIHHPLQPREKQDIHDKGKVELTD